MEKIACFTGHRPNKLGGYHGEKAEKIKREVEASLRVIIVKLYEHGFRRFISGGAGGVDQIAAWVVIALKEEGICPEIELVIAKPFPSQDAVWPKHIQEEFKRLCEAANEVVEVSEDPYTIEKMHIRNRWMVDKSIFVIGVWNGGYGGTKNCIDYARKVKRPMVIVNPYTLKEKWEGIVGL